MACSYCARLRRNFRQTGCAGTGAPDWQKPIMSAMLIVRLLVVLVVAAALPGLSAAAQQVWEMQESGTTAGLRGIDSVDGTVAWASGTGGTVLRTVDGGAHWTRCAVPDGDKDGATLDFRGVQAWDATTAIVMASGPGDKSRLYKTSDGCKTWKLLLKNSDPDGFYDAFTFWDREHGFLLGDPIGTMPGAINDPAYGVSTKRQGREEIPHSRNREWRG